MSLRRVVVVGASLAGATTAVTLRRLGFTGQVVLIGDEPHPPYERPGLSKAYLAGEVDARACSSTRRHVRGVRHRARSGSTAASRRPPSDRPPLRRRHLPYDVVVLATGSTNIRPPIPGMDLAGVHQLRRLEDADRLSAGLRSARSVVVVGMGFIGCEVAATARGYGLDVTMVDRLSGPLVGPLGPALSGYV